MQKITQATPHMWGTSIVASENTITNTNLVVKGLVPRWILSKKTSPYSLFDV